ncbi:MAG: hypothetical protein ACQEXJ_21050 [Myxococcota bacterium]
MTLLAIDASVLNPFARADRLADLEWLTRGYDRVTTRPVIEELRAGAAAYPTLLKPSRAPWLRVDRFETLELLEVFARYKERFGPGPRDVGEATILAWTEVHGGEALLDDQTAYTIGAEHGLRVRRTLGFVARALRDGRLGEGDARDLVDALIDAGARLPCDGASLLAWCRRNGLR